jgi:hypothetical protein
LTRCLSFDSADDNNYELIRALQSAGRQRAGRGRAGGVTGLLLSGHATRPGAELGTPYAPAYHILCEKCGRDLEFRTFNFTYCAEILTIGLTKAKSRHILSREMERTRLRNEQKIALQKN